MAASIQNLVRVTERGAWGSAAFDRIPSSHGPRGPERPRMVGRLLQTWFMEPRLELRSPLALSSRTNLYGFRKLNHRQERAMIVADQKRLSPIGDPCGLGNCLGNACMNP